MTDAQPSPASPKAIPDHWPAIVAALVFFLLGLVSALGPADGDPRDFFIYRLGAQLAVRGENPYNIPTIRQHVAEQFPPSADEPIEKSFSQNCGYFLPPMAALLYMPFAMLPWFWAKIAWAVVNGFAGYFIARLPLALYPRNAPKPPAVLWVIVPFLLLIDPSIAREIVFPTGQTSVLFLGCVAAGLLAYDRGLPYLTATLWVLPFVKPHLALSLIPLLWFLAGWRPTLLLIALVALLNAVGATVIGGSPLFLKEYFDFLPTTREAVKFNQVKLNPSIVSWNRLLFASGGPLIELSAVTTVAGYLVWYGLLIGRWAVSRTWPSAAWATAATAAGAVLCSQVLVYELMFLAAAVPWVRDLFLGGYRYRGGIAVCLLAGHLVPWMTMKEMFGFSAHHPLGVALFALVVLTGPMNPLRIEPVDSGAE
ncbi:MAG: DUF2029 domain-containing protein [Planctomycetes bacterium]|nr:DUF2029 domain-containing protein [Planctomycetota bacterium]